jgi:hypothetical protein
LWKENSEVLIIKVGDAMTQDEKDVILGRTRRQYREAKSDLGFITECHAQLLSELKKFLQVMEQEPMKVYIFTSKHGTLQTALEKPEVQYFYDAALADRLTLDSMGKHLAEYRTAAELVENRRKSLIALGDGDPEA